MRRFFIVLAFLILTTFLNPTVYGLEKPHQYFDWNRYPITDDRVLGETTASSSPRADGDYKNLTRPTYFFGFFTNVASDNPLYFLKKMEEGINVTFTFNPESREQKRLGYAAERLAEMRVLAEKGKTNLVSGLTDDYQDLLNEVSQNIVSLKKQGRDVNKLVSVVDVEAARHSLILEELALRLPAQAEGGIRIALSASEQAMDTTADVLGKPAVPEEVVQRLQSLKAQGLLSPEEVAKLINVDSRQKAREEMRKYTQAGFIPQADFKKMDEAARNYFPFNYMTIVEVKKFNELRQLETQKPDTETIKKLQEFASSYKPGEIVPTELRRFWVPMVRLEELQNTVRPDLISEDFFKYRPEEKQKYQEVVERMKPRKEDVEYINQLVQQNPNLLNDPSFARIKAIGDRFGPADPSAYQPPTARNCSTGSHWVGIPFMPEGGYCAPNYNYSVNTGGEIKESSCPPAYHRGYPGGPCIPDNPNGSGINNYLPAPGSCPAGYSWKTESSSSRGGYCMPDYTTSSNGGYPGAFSVPAYCPPGQVFREGKCEQYNPPPKEGCQGGSFWNGEKCITPKNCGSGYYQDSSGECRSSSQDYERYKTKCADRPMPPGGCGGGYWDMESCSCKTSDFNNRPESGGSGNYQGPSLQEQEAACRAGGGTCVSWVNNACGCERPGGTNYGNYSGGGSCGSGYYWTGSYCAPSSSGSSSPSPSSQPSEPSPPPSSPPPESQPTSPPPESQPPPPTSAPPSEPQPTSSPPQ